jgi:hypothetical protein
LLRKLAAVIGLAFGVAAAGRPCPGQAVVQLPTTYHFSSSGSMLVPDRGGAGAGILQAFDRRSSYGNFGVGRAGYSVTAGRSATMVQTRVQIIDHRAWDRRLLGGNPEQFLRRHRAQTAGAGTGRSTGAESLPPPTDRPDLYAGQRRPNQNVSVARATWSDPAARERRSAEGESYHTLQVPPAARSTAPTKRATQTSTARESSSELSPEALERGKLLVRRGRAAAQRGERKWTIYYYRQAQRFLDPRLRRLAEKELQRQLERLDEAGEPPAQRPRLPAVQ